MPQKIPGTNILDYSADDTVEPTGGQTQWPKSQGAGGGKISPADAPTIPGTGIKDYGSIDTAKAPVSTAEDSLGDGTWSSWLHDATHPQDANLNRPQTWRDWFTKTYRPSLRDAGNAALDDVTFGGADYVQSKLPTALGGDNLANIRARTEDSQAAMGPMGPVLNAVTYAAPGLGEAKMGLAIPGKALGALAKRAAPTVGRYGAAIGEGSVANALSTAGHEVGGDKGGNITGIDPWDVGKSALVGGVVGGGAGAAADVLTPGLRWTGDKLAGRPGRSGETPTWAGWRQQAKTDPAAVQDHIQRVIDVDPTSPRVGPLRDLHGALNQSTAPGLMAHAATGAVVGGATHLFGLPAEAQILGTSIPAFASDWFVNPAAVKLNRLDRNINVGKAFDRNFAPATNRPAVTGNSSGWADLLRQGLIGANSEPPS